VAEQQKKRQEEKQMIHEYLREKEASTEMRN
jgi:hypothetical protein